MCKWQRLWRESKNDGEKEENETTDSESTIFGEGKGVKYERGNKDVALV